MKAWIISGFKFLLRLLLTLFNLIFSLNPRKINTFIKVENKKQTPHTTHIVSEIELLTSVPHNVGFYTVSSEFHLILNPVEELHFKAWLKIIISSVLNKNINQLKYLLKKILFKIVLYHKSLLLNIIIHREIKARTYMIPVINMKRNWILELKNLSAIDGYQV